MFFFVMSLWLTDWVVAPSGGNFSSIQAALNVAQAGDRILVRNGTYTEQISFPRSGASGLPIQLQADTGHAPILDGTGFMGGNMVLINNRSFVSISGFEIRNLSQINDGSGVRILGSGTEISVRNNHIHHMLGTHAMAITVYGTQSTALSQITIADNWVHDCQPATSEAITLNGNINGFSVTNNLVTDVNNIGIDFIGGETDINPNPTLVARNGVCRGNTVKRARSNYGGGYAAGIYVDGGNTITIEGNTVSECDLGIEIGAENAGTVTSAIIVRNNWIYLNDKVGIVFGGYDNTVGTTQNCLFLNNTCYFNDTLNEGLGELWIQFASQNRVENNIFWGRPNQTLTYSESGNTQNSLNYNLWYSSQNPEWVWRGTGYTSFGSFQAASALEAQGLFANPQLADPNNGDGHILAGSPAENSGNPSSNAAENGSQDWDGQARISGVIDRGMDEIQNQPGCFMEWLALWTSPGTYCAQPQMNVLALTALLNLQCSCSP